MRTRPASKAQAEDATTSDAVFYVITSTKVLRLVWASRGLDPGSSAAHVLCNAIAEYRVTEARDQQCWRRLAAASHTHDSQAHPAERPHDGQGLSVLHFWEMRGRATTTPPVPNWITLE